MQRNGWHFVMLLTPKQVVRAQVGASSKHFCAGKNLDLEIRSRDLDKLIFYVINIHMFRVFADKCNCIVLN